MLVPLFAGLQYLVADSAPRVEVRLVSQAAPPADPGRAPVERIVERIVYVPVARSETAQLSDTSIGVPATQRVVEAQSAPPLSGKDSVASVSPSGAAQEPPSEAAQEPPSEELAAPDRARPADPADAPTPHMGVLAVVTPVTVPVVVAAAPVVRTAPVVVAAPVVRSAPRQIEVPVEEPVAEDEVADAPIEPEPVADEPEPAVDAGQEVAQVQMIDTTIEADQSARVISYRIPVRPGTATELGDGSTPVQDEPVVDAASDDAQPADAGDYSDEAVAEDAPAEAPVPLARTLDDSSADEGGDAVAEVQVIDTTLNPGQSAQVVVYRVAVPAETSAGQDEDQPVDADDGDATDDGDAAAQ